MRFPVPAPEKFEQDYPLPTNAYETVAIGASWLDKVAPGWERQIDISTLDIRNIHQCICGQLFETKDNHSGYGTIFYDQDHEDDHSEWFDDRIKWFNDHGFTHAEYTELWVALIKNRFDTGTLSDAE
jgi:hypothetical protein